MKKNALLCTVLMFTVLFFGCPDVGSVDPVDPVCTTDLENISFGVDSTYVQEGSSIGLDLIWNAVDSADSYIITTIPAQDTFNVQGNDTTLSIVQVLELEMEFEAQLSVKMLDGSTCGPILLKASYCNGGGTVEDVVPLVNWEELCNESECDFIRFISRDIHDCNGTLLDPIPLRLRKGIYYKRDDTCDCLTDGGTLDICDGVAAARLLPCLESLPKCLKHDYDPCE